MPPDGSRKDAPPPQPGVELERPDAALQLGRAKGNAERHRDVGAVADVVRRVNGEVQAPPGRELERGSALLRRLPERQVAMAAGVETLELFRSDDAAVEKTDLLRAADLQQ